MKLENHKELINYLEEQKDVISTLKIGNKNLKFLTNAVFPLERVSTIFGSEPETICWIDSFSPNQIFWDVGANMGLYSLYAAIIKDARVYSFEPESGNYDLLNKNIRLNNMSDEIVALCLGLSDTSGLDFLYKYFDYTSAAINSVGKEVDAHLNYRKSLYRQGVSIATGDVLLQNSNIVSPDHIKVDVDGFEHLVLSGMEGSILSNARSIVVEINTKLDKHLEIISKLERMGFLTSSYLTEKTTLKDGPWEGMVNMIFHKDKNELEKICDDFRALDSISIVEYGSGNSNAAHRGQAVSLEVNLESRS